MTTSSRICEDRHQRLERVDHVTHANDVTLETQMHLIERKCNLFKRVHMNANANANGNSQGNASVQLKNAKFYVPLSARLEDFTFNLRDLEDANPRSLT